MALKTASDTSFRYHFNLRAEEHAAIKSGTLTLLSSLMPTKVGVSLEHRTNESRPDSYVSGLKQPLLNK